MLNHIFTTPVSRNHSGLNAEQCAALCEFLLNLRASSPGQQMSNRGGWHSAGNLFAPEYQELAAVRDIVSLAIFNYISEAFGYTGEIRLSLTGWAVINRPGDYNVPHNHAANLLSGTLYLAVPHEIKGGAIIFQDPRLNLNAHETEGMRRVQLCPPWMSTTTTVEPAVGEILVFPSWLNHWVEPYQCNDPAAVRITVSFNASVQ